MVEGANAPLTLAYIHMPRLDCRLPTSSVAFALYRQVSVYCCLCADGLSSAAPVMLSYPVCPISELFFVF